jgi:16S rRNA (adenine1518-N6/adenine1519-N6)-dimethyltransferase
MNLFIELNNLVSKYRFYPKKGSGTHFIIKEKLIEEILALLEFKEKDSVAEFFAGEFFVARKLSNKKLEAFEERKGLIPLLEKELKIKPVSFLSFKGKIKSNKCFSFLPPGTSNEVIPKIMLSDFELIVLLLQKDAAEKILAEPGFSDYSFLSVFSDAFFEAKEVIEIKPDFFFPSVSGNYFLVKFIKKKKTRIKNKEEFLEFVKALFRFKNRVFISALGKAIPLMKLNKKTKEKIKKKIHSVKFNEKVYLTETTDFISLFNFLTE